MGVIVTTIQRLQRYMHVYKNKFSTKYVTKFNLKVNAFSVQLETLFQRYYFHVYLVR